MSNFKNFLRDQLEAPEIHADWDAQQNKESSQEQFRVESLPTDEK